MSLFISNYLHNVHAYFGTDVTTCRYIMIGKEINVNRFIYLFLSELFGSEFRLNGAFYLVVFTQKTQE